MEQSDHQFANYTFEGKEPWEEVKAVFHPHWATLAKPFLVIISLWAVLAVLFFIYKASWVSGWAMLGVIAFTILYGGIVYYMWSNTVGIITDYRVLQVRQRSLISREVYATMWVNVMSVTVSARGALASIFGYGMIVCDPGGTEVTVDLYAVPDVYRIQQLALTLMRRAQEEVSLGATGKEKHDRRAQSKKVFMD